MKGRIWWREPNELSVDVTDAIQVMYDLIVTSMDFGSGFWSVEDLAPVAELMELAQFDRADKLRKYVDDDKHYRETNEWRLKNIPAKPLSIISGLNVGGLLGQEKAVEHDHVYSAVGRCMWPRCFETKED